MAIIEQQITEAELREQFGRTGAIKGLRRRAARQALEAAIQFQLKEAA